MSFLKTFAKQFSWLALAEAWGKIVFFILLTIVARFGSAELGVYTYVLSIMGIFSIMSDFGTTGIYIREAKKNPADSTALFTQFLFLKFAIVGVFALASMVWLFSTHTTPLEWWYFVLYGIFVVCDTFTLLCLAHLRTKELFSYEAFVKIFSKVALLVVIGLAALFGSLSVFTVFVAYAVSGAVSFLTAGFSVLPDVIRRARQGTYRPRLQTMKFAFYESFPLGLSTVFWQIYYRIDTVLLKKMKGDVITGYYSAAYGVLQLINVLPALAMAVLFPKFVDQFHADPAAFGKRLPKYGVAFFCGGLFIALCTMLIAPIIPYYFGAEYTESVGLLRILACAVPILYLNHVLANTLVVIKKTSTLTAISFLGIVVNVSLNVALIPRYGAVAAAWTTAITEYSVALVSAIALRRAYRRISE